MKTPKVNTCKWHKPKGLGYISWFHWANKETSAGHEQVQCGECWHWFFPDEFGAKSAVTPGTP